MMTDVPGANTDIKVILSEFQLVDDTSPWIVITSWLENTQEKV